MTPYNIQVRFLGGLSNSQQAVFSEAAGRWSQIISADVPSVRIGNEIIDDLLIEARGAFIDGQNGVLGRAGPRFLRPGSMLPALGEMTFDVADLARMEADGSLVSVIIHEMGHVLGIGTIWALKGLLRGTQTADPVFVGANAMREFAALIGAANPARVPIENRGGPGTRLGHWRDRVFGHELMTGFINLGANPLSRLTIASLQDLGYEVNVAAAEAYVLPSSVEMALMGLYGEDHHQRCCMCHPDRRGAEPVVLPEEACIPR